MTADDIVNLLTIVFSLTAIGLCIYAHLVNRKTARILDDTARRLRNRDAQ